MTTQFKPRQVFALACTGMLLFGMVILALGSILPILVNNFDLSETEAGLLTAVLPAGVLLGSMVFGPIVDRYSYRYFLVACCLIVFMGVESLAYAQHFSILILAFFLIGSGGGALNGSINALVADISIGDSNKKSANLSFLGVFYGLGALGMPAIMGLLSSRYSYQEIFASLGAMALLLIPPFLMIKFPQPKQTQGVSLKEALRLLKEIPLILLGLFLFFEGGMEGAIGNWATIFLEKVVELSPAKALFGLSIFMLCLTLARLLLVVLLKRVRPYQVMVISMVLIGLGIFILMSYNNQNLPLVGLGFVGAGVAGCFPVLLGYLGTMYASLSGTAFSIAFAFALTGNILVNYLVGAFSLNFGLKTFPFILLTCYFFMIILIFFSLQKIKQRTEI